MNVREQVGTLLQPRSIALIGASESSGWSQTIVNNLRSLDYPGTVYMVNPKYRTQFGQACYPTVSEIPEPVDSAYVMTGAASALSIIEACGKCGIPSVTVLTSGFREIGPRGATLQDELVGLCKQYGIALLGPNCLGFVNCVGKTAAYAVDLVPPWVPGAIGLLTQSGGLLYKIHRLGQQRGIGFTYMVSSGNEAMLDAVDFMDYMIEDAGTRVVAALLETIRDPAGFLALADRAMEAGKPIVALKTGRSHSAHRAAIAHTGALAGEDRVVDAVFHQKGIVRVDTIEELVEVAALLAERGWPAGRRTAFITWSGGAVGILSDLAEGTRIEVPDFTPETKEALAPILPPFGKPQNPLDITGAIVGDGTLFPRAIETVGHDPNIDCILIADDPLLPANSEPGQIEQDIKLLADALHHSSTFWVAASYSASDPAGPGRDSFLRHGVRFANGFALAVRSLDRAIGYGEARRRCERRRLIADGHGHFAATRAQRPVSLHGQTGPLSEMGSKEVLRRYGIAAPIEQLVFSPDEAARAAREIGCPVVLKIQSPDVPHKTDAGGVRLDVRTPDEARAAFAAIMDAVSRHKPGARVDGVLVAQQVAPVVELIAGITRDEQFGPVVLVGLGGIFVEAMKNTSLRLPPLDADEVREMLSELRAEALFAGMRGRPRADTEAVVDAVVRLGRLAVEMQDCLAALDVNPLFVLPAGQGVLVGDALAVLDSHQPSAVSSQLLA